MRPLKQLAAELDATIERLIATRRHLPAAITDLRRQAPGFPATGSGAGTGGSSQANLDGKPAGLERHLDGDEVTDEGDNLDRAIGAAYRQAATALDIAERWAAPSRRIVTEDDGDPGCEIVARITRRQLNPGAPDGRQPCYEPTEVKATRGPKAKGHPHGRRCLSAHCTEAHVLERPYRLGAWARDFVRDALRLPTDDETIDHLRDVQVTRVGQDEEPPADRAERLDRIHRDRKP